MKNLFFAVVLMIMALLVSSCYQAVTAGVSLYHAAKGGTQAYHSVGMLKAMKNADPVFENYDAVKVEVLIAPRNEEKAVKLTEAFKDNMAYIIERDLKETGFGAEICSESCPEKTMVVQFKEKGYDESIAQKIFLGDHLRGRLYFIDKQAGTVVKDDPLDGVKDYADLLNLIHVSVATKALKTVEKKGASQAEAKAAVDRINKIDPIKDEYKDIFRQS